MLGRICAFRPSGGKTGEIFSCVCVCVCVYVCAHARVRARARMCACERERIAETETANPKVSLKQTMSAT